MTKASYWYLESDTIVEKPLPDEKKAYADVFAVAKKVSDARKANVFLCPGGEAGCYHCKPYEAILKLKKEGTSEIMESVGVGQFKQELFIQLKSL